MATPSKADTVMTDCGEGGGGLASSSAECTASHHDSRQP